MKNYFDKNTPLTIAMWDFSWLTCSHKGGSFYDLPRCVAEAAERGYNTLRVDVFPQYYVKPTHHFEEVGTDRRVRTWGDVLVPGGFEVDVRAKVKELADLCREHDIWLALDTWQSFPVLRKERGSNNLIPKEREEAVCRGWSEDWVKALPALRDDGVLERAACVIPPEICII